MSNPTKFSKAKLKAAHEHCALHKAELMQSDQCGCFCCLAEFPPSAITKWIKDENVPEGKTGVTALCPQCGIDSVIGSASGYPITQPFLTAMKKHFFASLDSSQPPSEPGVALEELMKLFRPSAKKRSKSAKSEGKKKPKST